MRATVERHEDNEEIPRVEVDIVKGKEDLTIKITDRGGGIPRSEIDNLFTYHYSTAPEPDSRLGIAPLVIIDVPFGFLEFDSQCSFNS